MSLIKSSSPEDPNISQLWVDYLKKVKETSSKDLKFKWAFLQLEKASFIIDSNKQLTKKFCKKIEDAKLEVKMDEHDWKTSNSD